MKDEYFNEEIDRREKEPFPKELPPEVKKELEKVKAKLDKFTKEVTKKFSYIRAVGLLPALPTMPMPAPSGQQSPQHSQHTEHQHTQQEQEKEKQKPEVIVIFPDDKLPKAEDKPESAGEKLKDLKRFEQNIHEIAKKTGLQINLLTRAPQELWQMCFDGHFADIERISMAYPLFDEGILSALRAATIHKNLVLRKFERYVTSYVIAGSLVRGQTTKTSDVDVYIVIDDTDVKRMPRFELKERLRAMIISFAFEANEIANPGSKAKNKLSPQIYILTEFWESVKDANPVIFTFIRDGVPLYDRGAFMPWKLLLKMGKIKPTPEAIDMFMSLGERIGKRVRGDFRRIVTEDIYWGVITPSQAALMLYGLPPPTPLETIDLMQRTFVDKEKMLEKKYIDILEKIVNIYKDEEHGRLKDVSGKQVDELLADAEDYIKRLKELVKQIEKHAGEQTVSRIYEDCFTMLKSIFSQTNEQVLIEKFKKEIVDKGIMQPRSIEVIKEITKAKQDYKKGKLTKQEIDRVRRDAQEFLHALSEYIQKKELIATEKLKFKFRMGERRGELYLLGEEAFMIFDGKEVKRINFKSHRVEESNLDELASRLKQIPKELEVSADKLADIRKILGKDISFVF